MEDWLKYLVCFILGWIISRMMGEGFSVGCVESPPKDLSQINPKHKELAIKSLNKIIEMDNDEVHELHTDVKSKLHHPLFNKVLIKVSQLLKIDAKEKIKNINLTTGVINEIKQIANHLINKLQDRDSFSVGGQDDLFGALVLIFVLMISQYIHDYMSSDDWDRLFYLMLFLAIIQHNPGGGDIHSDPCTQWNTKNECESNFNNTLGFEDRRCRWNQWNADHPNRFPGVPDMPSCS